ncbi:MAG: glutathione S-transferase [Salinarimonas sp.]|nr:glutathione S-transferase [Salinarimonas sp.]
MKLYDGGRAPNPRRVRIYLAEKNIEVPTEPVDIGALAQRSPEFTALNPMQRTPVLVLDDGAVIAESIAICRYFEELFPTPPLFGTGALERAQIEMWQRRVELGLLSSIAAVFRHLHPAMVEMEVPQVPEWGEANKPKVLDFLGLLDRHLADREYLAGSFSVADITGLVAFDFLKPAKLAVPDEFVHVKRWHGTLKARPSAAA